MQYSKELIREIGELYGSDLKARAEQGQQIVGRYLDDSSHGGISVETILAATSLEELKRKATDLQRKKQLYRKWCKEMYPDNQ